jgi:hypothetical protein
MATEKEGQAANGCPIATQDISVNINNRQVAIDKAHYGPMLPEQPSTMFWKEKARIFNVPVEEAKKARCGNCAAFIQTNDILECIATGLGEEDPMERSWDTISVANLGFCNIFDFKCAGDRTCDAWVTGGPITK